jgi:hypothetical protein
VIDPNFPEAAQIHLSFRTNERASDKTIDRQVDAASPMATP